MKFVCHFMKTACIVILLFAVLGCGSIFYAFKVEPYRVKYNEYTLQQGGAELSEVKIVQVSDFHIKEDFTHENLKKIINKINAQNPDVVLFTGDLYDNYALYNDDENIIAQLQKIEAKYAKLAVWGNRDYGGGAVRQYRTVMEEAGFCLLENENEYLTLESGKSIMITGLDDTLLGNPIIPDDTNNYETDFQILLTHEPDSIENYMEYSYDLALSGHSHGGQFKIPFLSFVNEMATAATSLSSVYNAGMYTKDMLFENRDADSGIDMLYVNTGIGTTHILARVGVVPEIAVFHLYI